MSGTLPLRVAIHNDYRLIVAGLASLLSDYPDQVEVVELTASVHPAQTVDLTLYDSFGTPDSVRANVAQLVGNPDAGRVVVYSWDTTQTRIDGALDAGAAGYLSKSLDADDLVTGLVAVADGKTVVRLGNAVPEEDAADRFVANWPGRQAGLTPREAELLALITSGLRNEQVAQRLGISINSVKTHIRHAYAKIGVDSRSQAVRWGMEHGLLAQTFREEDLAQ